MKKQLLTLALLAVAGTAGAQQLPNGSFDEGKWVDCVPFTNGASSKKVGKCPPSWTIAHVAGAVNFFNAGWKTVGEQDNAGNTGTAVKIYNTTTTGNNPVPGYITLGTTWNTAQDMGVNAKDGGSFGGISFKCKPDALEFYFKRSITGANTRSSFIAYLWNGTVTQNNVPVTSPSTGSPKTYNMPNRDIFVLRKDDLTASCQGDKNPTNPTHLIASLEEYTTETTDAWTKKTYEFKYNDTYKAETPEFINVIFAASDYFNSSNVTDGVSLSIDDVKLIYYKHLKSLTIDGTTPSSFVGDETQNNTNEVNIDASDKYYTKDCISATEAGAGAKVNETYNPSTHVCTLKVTAGDGEVKNYNIQFGVPCTGKLSSLTVNGTTVELVADKYYYVVTGDHTASSVSYVTEDGDKATAEESYDADKRISTITVTAPGVKDHTYYVKFAKTTTDYKGKMSIAMEKNWLSAATSTVGITTPVDGKADFQLLGFELQGMGLIGDIFVTDVPYTEEDGVVNLYKAQTITIFGDMGALLKELPVVLKGTLKDGKLTANIGIAPVGVTVDIVPLDATSLDLSSNAVNFDATPLADMKADMTNKNLTIFLPEGTEGVGADEKNVVVGTAASNLSLTDGNDWGVTKDFTAAAVNYDRAFNTDASYVQSFVLPFGFTVPAGTTVAELSSVNGDNLVFKPVAETVANKPYLVVTTDKDFINKLTNVEVKATTGADLTTTVDGVSHIGSYTAQSVKGVYGYANGKFVKATTGSVKPFRTYIKVAGTQAAPMAFGVNIEGTVTGINNATTAATAKEAIYNLQGVRVSGDLKHLTKGVYIVNGQKVVVK